MITYLFYDLETTGLHPAFDQIIQFAAIRTDADLRVLEEIQFRVKLRPDVIPHPRAVLTHQISPLGMQEGLTEYEAMRKIHALLNTPGTLSLGYNTLGFDDEFLRFGFYRNLLTPYTHQFANQCGRMDIYPIAVFYYLFARETLAWPEKSGKLSLKLEAINELNHFAEGAAHDAMVDVRATLGLARKLSESRTLWAYCQGYFQKGEDQKRMQGLREGLCVDASFGVDAQFRAPVLSLGQHRHYKNQWLWLRLDLPNLQEATPSHIAETTWAIRKKLGEPGFILPVKERFLKEYDLERQKIWQENVNFLKAQPQLLQAITDYHLDFQYPIFPETDVDAALYQMGFMSDADQRVAAAFHAAEFQQKSSVLTRFSSADLQELAKRILWRQGSENLEVGSLQDYKGQAKLTASAALEEIHALKVEGDASRVILELEEWLHDRL